MTFNLGDYVDVAERIREFNTKYPEGSLQAEATLVEQPLGWLCVAKAYRTADDERPGIGHAFEPVPGKTPYTKDSELMNAETSAWGRAIVALGFDTKKIASQQEVAARQVPAGSSAERPAGKAGQPAAAAPPTPAENREPKSPFAPPPGAAGDGHGFAASRADAPIPEKPVQTEYTDSWRNVTIHWSKNKDKTLGELTEAQRRFYAEKWAADPTRVTPMDRRLRQAARISLGVEPVIEPDGPFAPPAPIGDDSDIPF